ncbi:tax1-binding protein 1 homolog B-like isoform X1 [Polyodon spathula]|uniref:tax1-binding protein 1 homolog B-like isoform X1 n=1 Tax=Polyodon spathula TaxID=7913 RepID=UPI001B7F1D5F|nr:tax1-binding protein 1 homolog B-like isoform X1 [Polyodon spathula]XP_041102305.1 tax1-binding protein 1 homolog B-like isoform X1 [Polyodon spathula]XP_041102306.1 tax1-binding protein 1 homolog B-like isoform X1 [Polyodon spathula]XP_041102307.1 tax1-binding protein 1 homolog B-like isoform X1 [Polyodon spathula]
MSLFEDLSASGNTAEMSNFAHVIFQNVAKSYLPHAAVECHYTLTPYIRPHPKDWVGIFKVGWSTARDYFTFLWSPLPEKYVEGTSVNCVVVFQGYYVPNDDAEFYQFCYVTHKGEIRGASTPFQFRATSPTDDLLTMEDESNSDMLVVTTKTGMLEYKIKEVLKEKEELMKVMSLLQKEKDQLEEQAEKLGKEVDQEKETCAQIKKDYRDILNESQTLKDENEEIKKKYENATSQILQLEDDLIGVSQKAIEKETELDSFRGRLKKLSLEKEQLESQLKNEKDEKELYKIHLKNTELENTKLTAEVQTLKSVAINKENLLTQLREELGMLKMCIAEKEKLQKEMLTASSTKIVTSSQAETGFLREQLRKSEDQLQATRQEVSMLAAELRDVVSVRDRTMSDLYTARLEIDSLKKSLGDAEAECKAKEGMLQNMKAIAEKNEKEGPGKNSMVEQELRREVEDLKLRLQMAAEHYKEKYKECQKLQKQAVKLTEQAESKKTTVAFSFQPTETAANPDTAGAVSTSAVTPASSNTVLHLLTQEKTQVMNKEMSEINDKYKKYKQMLTEEKEKSSRYADDLARMEMKWKEQFKINESLKLQLAADEDRYQNRVAEKGREVNKLKENLELVFKENRKLEEELQKKMESQQERVTEGQSSQGAMQVGVTQPVFLQYPIPYLPENLPATLVAVRPPELRYGNPYSTQHKRDGADVTFSPDQIHRPPVGAPSWDDNVVCIQPARNLSRPDGLEDPEELSNDVGDAETVQSAASDTGLSLLQDRRARFCFDSSIDIHKKCPLCEVIFPPNYDQSKFEEHVESHWKVCPICSEQFPLDFDQCAFEKHVQTHFDGNVLNFD